ncbi:hypothetical protein Avbf_09625 [Armadillidium vulgare]|nr:hypothetical protein Avbf_09625 [Armadillidium vulgare]
MHFENSFFIFFSHHHLHPHHFQDKPEQTFLDIFRSSSRSDSRNSNRSGVEDLGLMKHRHKEYTSPDKTTKIVSDQFEYESGDPDKYK